ncbi:hypothetical protein B296_00056921, partial [Ensete ventricosum]
KLYKWVLIDLEFKILSLEASDGGWLMTESLNLLLTLYDILDSHVLNYDRLIIGLLHLCLGFFNIVEGQALL